MKKTLFFILFTLGAFVIKAQEIHQIPTDVLYDGTPDLDVELRYINFSSSTNIEDPSVEANIQNIIDNYLPAAEAGLIADNKDVSVLYARRVQSHILLYYHFDQKGDFTKRDEQLTYFDTYFVKLLGKQCVDYALRDPACAGDNNGNNGGFTSPVNGDYTANPRTTAIGLNALLDARKFLKIACNAISPIPSSELEDRILQAKNALLAYSEFNNQYLNLTAFGFNAAAKHVETYNDLASKNFLATKGAELLNKTHPLRPNPSIEWDYAEDWNTATNGVNWNEGQQADGSWKDFARDLSFSATAVAGVNPRIYDPFERWHDSEMDYHGVMIEGLANLHRFTSDPTLRNTARTQLINSINHIIDYNGELNGLENTSFDPVFQLDNYEHLLKRTRLTLVGRVAKYHRETSDYSDFLEYPVDIPDNGKKLIQKTVPGNQLLRGLIEAERSLRLTNATDISRLDMLINGIAFGIIYSGVNNTYEQLYDLSLFLNRHAINGNIPGTQYTNDKLIVSFDHKLISAFHQDDLPAGDDLARVDNFYVREQQSYQMVAGDFNNDTDDEAIISFEYGNIYRYAEDANGRLATTELVYGDGALTLALESGDFNNNNHDELIVALDNGEIRRYEEDINGDLALSETFYTNTSKVVVAMEALDFNNDGKDELVVAFDDKTILRFRTNSSDNLYFTIHAINHAALLTITELISGDFDGDNLEELILTYDNGLVERYYESTSGITQENLHNSTITVESLASGDFNGDNKDELIIAFSDNHIKRYHHSALSNTLTTTSNDIVYNGSQLTTAMTVGNFNADTEDELIISFEYGNINRCTENGAGNLLLTELVSSCGNLTNAMIVLQKNQTSSRATTETIDMIQNTVQPEISIYPNPANEILNIRGVDADTEFSIHSLDGKRIMNGVLAKGEAIDVSKLVKGFYILRIENQAFKILKK
jgi:glycerophosphoryl diester phosphodiesterase